MSQCKATHFAGVGRLLPYLDESDAALQCLEYSSIEGDVREADK